MRMKAEEGGGRRRKAEDEGGGRRRKAEEGGRRRRKAEAGGGRQMGVPTMINLLKNICTQKHKCLQKAHMFFYVFKHVFSYVLDFYTKTICFL